MNTKHNKPSEHEINILSLTLRDCIMLAEALSDDQPPNQKLKKAAERYKAKMGLHFNPKDDE